MKKAKQVKYLNKQFKKMLQQFKLFVQTQSPEALHAFRVQVKKIKSFLTLLEAGNNNDALSKTFRPVKKIFRSAGIIRSAQIHEKQARENNINPLKFHKEQHEIQQEVTARLVSKQHKLIHTIKKVKKQLQHQMHPITNKAIRQFFTKQIQRTRQLLKTHDFTEQLHNGRKMLKHLLYNRRLIPNVADIDIDFNKVDAMQQVIGEWHDNKLALEYFRLKLPEKKLIPIQQKQEALQKNVLAESNSFLR